MIARWQKNVLIGQRKKAKAHFLNSYENISNNALFHDADADKHGKE